MTELNDTSERPPSARLFRALVAWLVIAASVAYVMINVIRGQSVAAAPSGTNDVQILLIGRLLVTSSAVSAGGASTKSSLLTTDPRQAMAKLDQLAKTPDQKLNAAIVAGEIDSGAEALRRIDDVEHGLSSQALREDIIALRAIYLADDSTALPSTHRISPDPDATLIAHRGWFGELAAGYGKPPSDPHRQAAGRQSLKTAGVVVAAGAVAIVGGLLSVLLLVLAIILVATGTIRPKFRPVIPSDGAPLFLEAFAFYIAAFILIGLVLPRMGSQSSRLTSIVGSTLSTLILPAAIAWPAWNRMSLQSSLLGFGWHDLRHVFREALLGFVGYLTGLPIVIVGDLLASVLSTRAGVTPTHPIINELSKGGWTLVAIYVLACIWAPIMEESMFRGALFNHLRARWSWFIAAPIVGLVFAAIHPQGWTFIPVLAAIGIVLAGIREWRGSIIASIFAHGLNNFLVVTLGYLMLG